MPSRLLFPSVKGQRNCQYGLRFATLLAVQGCILAAQSERRLPTSLLQDYNRSIRPVRSSADPVVVTVQMFLLDILSLEESNNRLSLRAWMSLNWVDEFLSWNPEKYGGVERLNFATECPNVKLWTPDITVLNSLKMEFDRGTEAVVHWNGTVTWIRPFTLTLPMSYEFRGNAWTAMVKVASWTYDESLLQLQPLNPAEIRMTTGISTISDHWALLTNTGHAEVMHMTCCRSSFSSIVYVLRLRKKIGSSLMGRRSAPMENDLHDF